VTKEVSIGLPFEAALEKLGYSPQAISRILDMRAEETFLIPEPDAQVAPEPPVN